MAGTEQPLMNTLSNCVDYIESIKRTSTKPNSSPSIPKPPLRYQLIGQPLHYYGGGSVNHKFLRIIVDLCLAYIYNDKDYISTCEQRLILFLKEQEEKGHCCVAKNAIETLSGSHGQLNIAAASVAYLFWCYYGQSINLGILLTHWHWSELLLIQNCKLPNTYLSDNGYSPTFHCPGWRAIKGSEKEGEEEVVTTSNPARDLYGRILLGYSYPSNERKLYKDKYNLGARCMLLLNDKEREKLLPTKEWKVPVPYDYIINYNSNGNGEFVCGFYAPINKDICIATGYKDGQLLVSQEQINLNGSPFRWETITFRATEWSKKNRVQP